MTTSRSAVRLRNAAANLLRDIGEEHDGWTLEEPPEDMKMGCDIEGCDHVKHAENMRVQKLEAARDAVVEAAKKWSDEEGYGELGVKVQELQALEQPADPLEPVREFVAFVRKVWGTPDRISPYATGHDLLDKAEKALGMVKP